MKISFYNRLIWPLFYKPVTVRDAADRIKTLVFLIVAVVIAVHAPGHVSMDTSIQLHEAAIGQSISWNPPFMSAMLAWLGGGQLATTAVVFISTVLLYGSFAIVADTIALARKSEMSSTVAPWRSYLSCLLILNPIIAIYAGIVWKDVLFASFLTAGAACGICASEGALWRRLLFAFGSVFLLACSMLVRQQGVFMAPVLLLIPIIALSSGYKNFKAAGGIIILFFATMLSLSDAVQHTIHKADGRSSSVGYRSIMIFDMTGIVTMSARNADELAYPITAIQLEAVRRAYDPSRIDMLARDPIAEAWLGSLTNDELKKGWVALIRQNPAGYLKSRTLSYATLLGMRGIGPTAPVHIGVDGNPDFLKEAGMREERTARDFLIYSFASSFFEWPIYRHYFWISALLVAGGVAFMLKRSLPRKLSGIFCVIFLAAALLYFSFLPTTISSDFRYLFGGIPLVTLLWLILLLCAKAQRSGNDGQ